MQTHPISLTVVPKVSEIENAISFGYTYYPVINSSNQVVGSICKDFLITLMENKAFYSKTWSGSKRET